ncbi:AMP-binding protein [Vibrio sp. J1-1]|uniref:AMP-binding protein n=1 Tax=Vibrio sp. J1-1 TaxID=2912251 RepID=UPI001F465975|nr:AMP-binding protein [Vibrio sp. J1-1]MCF7483045.1 AMP-binding protein [Vibrio sp. J1-1]
MNILFDALNKWAITQPNHVALVGQDELGQTVQITYSALLSKIEHTAEALNSLNIEALALRTDNSVNWAIIDLAAMAANIVVVPIPTFFSDAQVAHTLRESRVDALIGDWQKVSLPASIDPQANQNINTEISGLAVLRTTVQGAASYLTGTGKITFTSGSTGQPKGVCLSNVHLCEVARSLAQSVDGLAKSHMVLLPLSTLLENITGIYVPLFLGATSYILPGNKTGLIGSSQFDTALFAKVLAEVNPDSLVLTPALLLALIQIAKQKPDLANSLKFVAVGGARVSSSLINAAHSLNIPAFEGYGLSECGSVVCLNTPSSFKAGTCGKPLPHTQIRIAEDGELHVKGSIALGYLNEPFSQEWFATGDLAQLDEQGFVTLSGRKKNLIVTAYGRNVSPEWIESEALAFLPNVPLIVTGDGRLALCAIVATSEKLIEKISALNSTLPDYARIQTLLVIHNPRAIRSWYTENDKLKRSEIEHSVNLLLNNTHSEFMLEGQKVQKLDLPLQQSIAS